jgi:RNA polymerase sigma-70 factor (ECF subfamily)
LQNIDEIVERCKDQDRQAQKELFERFAPKMMSVCMRYCRNEDDAKDVLQDGFVKIFTKIKSFKGESRVETWMARIMVHTSLNFIQRVRKANLFVEFNPEMEVKDEGYEADQEQPEVKEVMKAVNELPEIYRIVINMYAVDGMGHKEIANILGITEGSSKSRLSRGRQLLKKQFDNKD